MLAVRNRSRRRVDRPLVIVSLAIAVGLGLILWGLLVSVTGDERDPLPDAIESVDPAPEAQQVPQQSGLVIDFQSGYKGTLAIDGVEIPVVNLEDLTSVDVEPGQQIDVPPVGVYEQGNATISFTPSDGATVTELTSGRHIVRVSYWRLDEGPNRALSYSWEFEVV